MSWLDEEFPPCISYGAVSAPVWATTIAVNQGGYEQRNQDWTQARHEYDLSFAIRTQTDYLTVLKHWHMARGQLHSFGITDPLDYEVLEAESFAVYVSLGVAQLYKRYGTGSAAWDRKITRPKPGAVVYRNGSPATPGAGAGQYALDEDTGRVTFVADQTRSITSHTVGASHIIGLASDFSPNVSPGGYVGITGVTGTAASLLNGKQHLVTTVGVSSLTIAADTTGLTASGGTAARTATAAEITWSGEFMVPVRYNMPRMPAAAVNRRDADELLVSVDGVGLVEVRE